MACRDLGKLLNNLAVSRFRSLAYLAGGKSFFFQFLTAEGQLLRKGLLGHQGRRL